MKPIARLGTVVAGLVLLVNISPTWGGPPNPTDSDANDNTAGGTFALSDVVSGPSGGSNNTGFGFEALTSNTTGDNNTACGAFTLISNVTGSNNTAVGDAALESNDPGDDNTATGFSALISNTTGSRNTANASSALISNTSGADNTASGFQALFANGTGSKNTAVGSKALSNSIGNKNIAIGFKAGATLTSGNNNIYIGNPGGSSESQTIRVGTAQTQTFVAGIATATVSGATVEIDTTTGRLGIATSSARYKRDIAPMGKRSEGVLQLRPVTFAYRDDAQMATHYGLIAEEVAAVYPELVTRAATGEVQTVRYQELIPMLLNEFQRERQEFQQALERQQQELADLRAMVRKAHDTASLPR